ncbi:hypothetical protein P7K49_005881 [Saguinus oedipus]|uniref:Uncharacterized protein n=1 Tax=Saguinus oedipus TaxID=9490 RepID=A0ABQ9W1D9_SAGOE|nr:hypothetical protein P7K49_005881 [Saguinus oedipus]
MGQAAARPGASSATGWRWDPRKIPTHPSKPRSPTARGCTVFRRCNALASPATTAVSGHSKRLLKPHLLKESVGKRQNLLAGPGRNGLILTAAPPLMQHLPASPEPPRLEEDPGH